MKTSLESGVWSLESAAQHRGKLDPPRTLPPQRTYAPLPSAASLLCDAVVELTAYDVPDARLDAEVLLAHALETDRAGLYARLHDPCPNRHAEAFRHLIQRRGQREPLQYITGTQEFWSLEFKVDVRVLIPRPETEMVVETALRLLPQSAIRSFDRVYPERSRRAQDRLPQSAIKVLDVGTGSGCIAIALATELPQVEVWAVDISQEALTVADENTRRHGVAERIKFLQGDLFAPIAGERNGFDLIVANPPYIGYDDLATLQPEVRDWEPYRALDGGVDGLDFYRRLLSEGPDYLRTGGWLVMEIGQGQRMQVLRLAQDQRSLSQCSCIPDYTGNARVVVACKL